MQSHKPGIIGLAIFAGLAGVADIVGALQSFGVLPAAGGASAGFFVSDPVAGTIQLAAALFTFALSYGLWQQRSWSRKALVAIAAVNIGVVFFTHFVADEGWLNAVPGTVLNAALLLYARTPAVRQELDQ